MSKVTLADVSNIFTSATTINDNNNLIEAAIENTLSRDGTSPNAMNANLDMNGYRIINLPAPVGPHDPVRKEDFDQYLNYIEESVQQVSDYVDEALGYKNDAAASAGEAENFSDVSKSWAQQPYGEPVLSDPNGRSSLHYSEVAHQWSTQAQAWAQTVGGMIYDFGLLSDGVAGNEDWGTL